MEKNKESYNLDDTVVAHIAQLLQLAIILQRDITEQLRSLKVSPSDGKLVLDPEYKDGFDREIKKLIGEAEEASKKAQKEQQSREPGFVQ